MCLILFSAGKGHAQEINKIITDPKREKLVLIDKINRDAFLMPVFGEYYQQDYDIYKPDDAAIQQIAQRLTGISITIVLGSWCGDSREQLPRFMKVLDQSGFDFGQLQMIAVDSYKVGRAIDVSKLNIERVPTFIVLLNGKEIGRIVETPLETLETDLLKILQAE